MSSEQCAIRKDVALKRCQNATAMKVLENEFKRILAAQHRGMANRFSGKTARSLTIQDRIHVRTTITSSAAKVAASPKKKSA